MGKVNVWYGEALVGEGNEVAHIDLAIGTRGSPVEYAMVQALANPRWGHTPLYAILEPNLMPKPVTLIQNKVTLKRASGVVLQFGPAQAAVGKAVADSVEEGVINRKDVDDLVIIASVFIHWNAEDKDKIYEYNYEATKLAIKRALNQEPSIEEVLAKKDTANHPFR